METGLQTPLLPRIAQGDSAAVADCIERYGGLVWSLARRLSPTPTDAEDAVQEIFVDLWRNADRFRQEVAAEPTFVALLARRRLIDRQRKRRRQPDTQPLDQGAAGEAPAPPEVHRSELADDAAQALACLEHLRSDERQVLQLSIYQGLPQARIAEQTGLPLGTVKTHARRGLAQLRDCMQAKSRQPVAGGVAR